MTNRQIASDLNVHEATVSRIIKKYNQTGSFCRKKTGGDHRSLLNDEQKNYILQKVDENCSLTLKQLADKVFEKFNLKVSRQTIQRTLNEFHYTLKKVSLVPTDRNSPRTISLRFE